MSIAHETVGPPDRVRRGRDRRSFRPSSSVLGLRRPLVIAGRSQAAHADRLLAAVGAGGSIIGVRVHVPAAHAEVARARATELAADCLVSIGGGSAVGLAKAVALSHGLPIAAVPTTYAGSELTTVWGITEEGRKTTGRDPGVAPRLVVYDPELTYDLPAAVTAASCMNAVAHCVEALWAAGATPLTDAAAAEGLRRLAAGMRASLERPRDPAARATALAGAWLAGEAFAAGGALHHKLCHVLGGMFDLPHAELHAALLPIHGGLPAARGAGGRPADRRRARRRRRSRRHRAARARRGHAALARRAGADRGRRRARCRRRRAGGARPPAASRCGRARGSAAPRGARRGHHSGLTLG